jgi:hypothetical protein
MWMAEAKAIQDIPLPDGLLEEGVWGHKKYGEVILPKGKDITITKGKRFKYALWCGHGIYDLPGEYVDETTLKIIVP